MNQEIGESKNERPLKPGEALIFSEENYGGQQQLITIDTPSLNLDFPAASLRIGSRTGVTVFAEEGCQGLAQELTTELPSFTKSRLRDQKPKSIKIWSTVGKPFTGYWAIAVAEEGYLSVGPDGVLTTNSKVSASESFRITDVDGVPGRVAFSLRGALSKKDEASEQPRPLTIDDFKKVALFNEQETGCRKFSLLSPNEQWIYYDSNENHFFLTTDKEHRTIFCKSIKIAEDETQVGELLQGEVALYENPSYWGKTWVFHTDYAHFENVVDLNDEVSSIQLGPLTGATIYRGAQYNAEGQKEGKQDVTSNLPSLEKEQVGEDRISSMDLWEIVPPEGMGISFTCILSQDFRSTNGMFDEYSAYRTTLRLPSTVKEVEVWTTDETDIEVEDQRYHIDEDHPVTLKPNLVQRLVITTDAVTSSAGEAPKGCLRAPGLKIRTNTMLSDQRIVIYPDQAVHERLANLKEDELWNATYKDKQGVEHLIIKDRSPQKKNDVANAQSMITKVMSTVKYTTSASGGREQAISPEGLQGKFWALDFLTYRVTAETLYVRKGPGIEFKEIGYLRNNEVVKVIEFNADRSWIHISRLADGLTGWSSSAYLGKIPTAPTKEEQYRVTASGLHVREGPGVEFRSLGHIRGNEIVTAIGVNDKGTWRKIVRSDGLTGWSSARYMTLIPSQTPQALSQPLGPVGVSAAAPTIPALLPTPLPATSGLTPNVKFHEISHEEVQALLARAESPDAYLAQGFFDVFKAIGRAIKSAVSVVVSAVEKAWQVIIDLGNKVVKWIIDTAEKVIACVEGIIEKIGAVIEEIIKWLRFIFEWKDIIRTRDYLRDSMNNMLDFMEQRLADGARKPVINFFKNQRRLITNGFDQAIDKLGGPSTNGSSGSSSGLADVMEVVDWILSKVVGGGMKLFGASSILDVDYPADADAKLLPYWKETLAKGAGVVSAIPEDLSEVINSLIKNPDEPQRAVVRLLEIFRNQLNKLLDMGEDIVLGLLDLAAYLIEKVKAILDADIRIPFISDLIEWVGKLLGQNWSATLGFSLLDVATLILAFPVTIISKARLGRAPFKNVPVLAANKDEWSITAGVAGFMGGLVAVPLDMAPETEAGLGPLGTLLEVLSLVFAVVNLTASRGPDIVSAANSGQDRNGNQPDELWWSLFGYDVFMFLLDSGSVLAAFKSKKVERFKRAEGWTIVLASILGGVHLSLLIAKGVKDEKEFQEILPDCLMTLPEICSALRLSKNPYVSVALGIVDGIAGETSLVAGLPG